MLAQSAISDLFRNPTFWATSSAWVCAQATKVLINHFRTGRVDFQYMVSLGGMPSAHSASVCALATSVGLNAGFGTQLFVATLMLAIVVMFDATTVRRAAGIQARLLNDIVQEFFREHHLSETKLVELLGHTRIEVFVGMAMGVLISLIVNAAFVLLGL